MKDRHPLRHLTIISIAVLGLGIAGVRFAGAHGPGVEGRGPGGPCFGQELSEEQQKQRSAFLDETADIRKNMAIKRAEMRALMRSDNPDTAQAAALSAELFDLRESMRKKAAEKGLPAFLGPGRHGMMGPGFGPAGHHGRGGPM